MGKQFLDLMNPAEVKKIIASLPFKKGVEKVSLEDSYQRVLAEDVYATISLPPFKRAAMDGYAVKAEETFPASEDKPVVLKLAGQIKTGEAPKIKLERGSCIEVSTGSPLPEGANAVVMVEFTEKRDKTVSIQDSVAIAENITDKGSDVTEGELILSRGTVITPYKIGVLSAVGMGKVPVFAQPKVAVISTGNEIILPDEELKYGKVYDINSQTISTAVKSCGCIPLTSEIVKDDYNSLKNKLNQFKDVDVIITSGGTSAGTGDVLRVVLDDIGEVLVHGIAVKPGKPTIIGLIKGKDDKNNKIIFGLPGYPVAAVMVFNLFVASFLKKMASLDVTTENPTLKFKLSRRFRPSRGRLHYVLVKMKDDVAYPILKDSGAITALAEADGYFEVPKNVEIIEKGTMVDVIPLEDLTASKSWYGQ
jgi:molybdopterin molybdotransferase